MIRNSFQHFLISPVACSTGSGMTWSALRAAVTARPLLDTWDTFEAIFKNPNYHRSLSVLYLQALSWSAFCSSQIHCTCVRVDLTRDRDMVFSETVIFYACFLKIQSNKVHTIFVLLNTVNAATWVRYRVANGEQKKVAMACSSRWSTRSQF